MKVANIPDWSLSEKLTNCILEQIKRSNPDKGETSIFNFRDPNYSAENGGYRPVEIMVSNNEVQYITEFGYVGYGQMAELAKSIDFSFESKIFYDGNREIPIYESREFFELWQSNFCDYYEMEVYEVNHESF